MCSSVFTSTRATSRPARRATGKAASSKQTRDGRVWHDLTDEFGDPLVHAGGLAQLHGHHASSARQRDACRCEKLSVAQRRRSRPVRRPARRALLLKKETPYAVVSGISGVVYEICWYLRGLEQWFCDLMTEPEFCEAMLDQTLNSGSTGSASSSTKSATWWM